LLKIAAYLALTAVEKCGVLRHLDNNKALYSLAAGAKLQAEKAYGFFSTALGRLGFGHSHALTA
jgi:hypothetical protein